MMYIGCQQNQRIILGGGAIPSVTKVTAPLESRGAKGWVWGTAFSHGVKRTPCSGTVRALRYALTPLVRQNGRSRFTVTARLKTNNIFNSTLPLWRP